MQHRGIVLDLDTAGGHQHVLDRGTFKRRSTSDVEETSTIFAASFSIAFGEVQRDRLSGAQPLVAGVTM